MSDPLFESRTARHNLPLLFSGQAQRELYVNESLARIDALLHGAIEAQAATPPASPTGAWSGQGGKLASFQQGQWLFLAPRDGLRVLNRATGQELFYCGTWKSPVRPAPLSGGAVIDTQARTAISALIDALVEVGVLPAQ